MRLILTTTARFCGRFELATGGHWEGFSGEEARTTALSISRAPIGMTRDPTREGAFTR